MVRLLRQRTFVWAGIALALALPPLATVLGAGYTVSLATRILIYGLVGVSLNLILGYGGMVSFGHAAFFGAGAYVVGILGHHAFVGEPLLGWPLAVAGTESAWVAWPAAMLVAALLALAIGAVSLRTDGLYFIMITLAFAQMLFYVAVSLPQYGGEDGLSLWNRSRLWPLDLGQDVQFYYLVLALLLTTLRLVEHLIGSRFGRVLRGIRDNERRMRALGFPTYRYKLTAFVLSGALAGLAGALVANQTEFVSPSFLSWHRSGEIFVIVLLGGMGTLFGPVAGSLTYLLLQEYLSRWTEHWMLLLGPVLLLVALYARRGIWGLVDRGESTRG